MNWFKTMLNAIFGGLSAAKDKGLFTKDGVRIPQKKDKL